MKDELKLKAYQQLMLDSLGIKDEFDITPIMDKGIYSGMSSTSSTTPLTMDDLLASVSKVEEMMREHSKRQEWKVSCVIQPVFDSSEESLFRDTPATVLGVPVYSTDINNCTSVVPKRVHKRRRGQTEAYHRRVQKKWTKRWGTVKRTHAFLADMGSLWGGRGAALIMPHDHLDTVMMKARQCGLQSALLRGDL